MKMITSILLFLAVYFGTTNYALANGAATDQMVVLINSQRQAAGITALIENPRLDESARKKACDMRDRNYFAHLSPDGKMSWELILKSGYYYRFAGENLGRDFGRDEDAMAKFMGSETHKANILGKQYREVGIGRCGVFIVQHYGKRQIGY